MKFLFIWPNKDAPGWKPISISLLSAILKKEGHTVDLFDTSFIDCVMEDNTTRTEKARMHKQVDLEAYNLMKQKLDLRVEFQKKLNAFQPDIVGVSALSDEIDVGLKLSAYVKEWNKETIVIWGNKLATMDPEKVLKYDFVDYICIGEGIQFIKEFMRCITNGQDVKQINNLAYKGHNNTIHVNPLYAYYQELDELPYLDWTIFDKRHFYKPYDGKMYRGGDHMITVGCPNICSYCINASYRRLYGRNSGKFLRTYRVSRIIDELKYLIQKWDISFFKFQDEDFCLKHDTYFAELSEQYASTINIPFAIMATPRNITPKKIKLLKQMNCVSVSIGIETGNSELRKQILKRNDTKEDIINAIKNLNDAGIRTCAYNMLGIPFETKETIFETIQLNREAQVRYPAAQFFVPLEGTELRKIAIENHFVSEDHDTGFRRDKPALSFPNLSQEELSGLMDRFTLYIKLPQAFRKYIDRSMVNDEIGKSLTQALYQIYEKCVFSNDGFWDNHQDTDSMLKTLEELTKTNP